MKENANQTVTLIMVKKKWSYRGGKGGSIWRKFSLHCFFFFFFYCLEKKRLHLYKPMLCWQLQNCGINCLLLYSQLSSGVSHGLSTLSTANCNVQLKKKKKNTYKSRNDTQWEMGLVGTKTLLVVLLKLNCRTCVSCAINIERSVAVVRWILPTVH